MAVPIEINWMRTIGELSGRGGGGGVDMSQGEVASAVHYERGEYEM